MMFNKHHLFNKNNNKNQQQMIGHGKEFQTKKVFFYQYFL
jgi:hypothetical protein